MGKKYIIELPENTHWVQWILESTEDHHPYMDFRQVEALTPYAEPDLDAIRKEEYEKGVQDTKQHWVDAPRSCAYKLGYENGLNDAWDAARKICGMKWTKRNEVFGIHVYADIIVLPVSECIEKIRQYEQRQEKLQVGDEVNAPFGKAVVVNIDFFAKKIWLVYADGHGGFEYFKDAPTKTGRRFPEIAEVLQKMKEAE